MNLFEITRQAYGGTGLAGLSRQFGLSPGETERALDALLPAFSLAFRRALQDPAAVVDLLGSISSGLYAPAFDAPRAATPGTDGGSALVQRLFGSPEASRRIAAEAAAMSGLGLRVMQDMMPLLAATLIGGVGRYASLEGFADLLRQWSDALRAASPKPVPPPPPADPWTAWAGLFGAMLPTNTERPGAAPAVTRPGPANPMEAWSGIVGAAFGGAPAPAPPPPPPSSALATDALGALSRMFDVGRVVQEHQFAAFGAILDGLRGTARTR